MKNAQTLFHVTLVALGLIVILCFGMVYLAAGPKAPAIRKLHRSIVQLQERLISAQIMAQKLDQVQKLIEMNLALSAQDSLARGASLTFLKDLTAVLDILQIGLVSLEPEAVITHDRYIETPYRLELACTYEQLCQLVNKMEKSPRLISVSRFEVENSVDDHFNNERLAPGQCRIAMKISTLTLIRKAG